MIAIDGTVNSHGSCPKIAASGGLVHSKTNVAATISCDHEWSNNSYYSLYIKDRRSVVNLILETGKIKKRHTLSATGSKNAPKAVPKFICNHKQNQDSLIFVMRRYKFINISMHTLLARYPSSQSVIAAAMKIPVVAVVPNRLFIWKANQTGKMIC